jgi:integrase
MRIRRAMARATGHLRIIDRKTGPVFYALIRTPEGKRTTKRIGPAWLTRSRPLEGHLTRPQAEAELARMLEELNHPLPAPGEGPEIVPTFEEVAEEWFRYVRDDRKRKESTVRSYRSELDKQLLPRFGDFPLTSITVEMIDGYREELVAEGRLAPRTINKRLTQIHSIFARARKAWRISHNPAADADRQPEPNSGDLNVLDARGIEALIMAADDLQDAVIYRVATSTGMRLGELRGLRWQDIDWVGRSILIRNNFTYSAESSPKSGKIRSVPVSDQAAAALNDLSRRDNFTGPDDLVFVSPTGHFIDDSKLRKRFHAALQRAGLPRMRLHDLLHTFGTIAVQIFPLSDVNGLMGIA